MAMSKSAQLGLLHRADGSASFTQGSTTIIVSVNGPMEVKVRDELPGEAYIEVIVRPAIGVSGTRERYLESRLLSALKPIILRSNHPRTLIQIVVQIAQAFNHNCTSLLLSPAINASVLALIDAGVPLKSVVTATSIVKGEEGFIEAEVGAEGQSRFVLGFTSMGELVFVDAEGAFDVGEFEEAVEVGRRVCVKRKEEDVEMEEEEMRIGVGEVVRDVVEGKVKRDLRWRE